MSDRTSPDPDARRTVGGGASLTTGASLATAAFGGALGVLVARVLGPADTGAYNVVAAALFVSLTTATIGINVGATYRASNRSWDAGDAFRQLQLAALVVGIAAAGLGVALAALTQDSLFQDVPLGVVAIALGALPFALSWTFTTSVALALDRYETFAVAPAVANGATLALAAVLTPTIGLKGAVIAAASGHLLNALWLAAWGRRELPRAKPGWLRRTVRELREATSFGFQGYLPQALSLLSYRADLFVLNAVAAGATVGHYAVALIVTEVGLLVPRSLAAVVMPRVAALHAEPAEDERVMVVTKSVKHSVLLALPVGLVLAVAVLLIPIVFGSAFSEAVGPGLILIPGVLALGVAGVLNANMIGAGHPRYALYSSLIATPVTLALYLGLIPPFEIWGAAGASTASYALSGYLALHYFRRSVGKLPLAEMIPGRDELHDFRLLAGRARASREERRPRRADPRP
jgi:O-antigen/teichoic acid export membrane protein